MHKRLFVGLLMALLMLSATALAAAPAGIWTDYAAAAFEEGTGAKEDPYQIATAEQLAKLAKDINDGDDAHDGEWFVLTADIDLSAHRWIPIGSGLAYEAHPSFSGYFDGDGHTITGLYVDESQECYSAGLFGNFKGYLLKDLTVRDAYVKTKSRDLPGDDTYKQEGAGILIGTAVADQDKPISVENCHVSGTVESEKEYICTGGMVGRAKYAQFISCTAEVTVNGQGRTGGFVGIDEHGTYQECTARGKVKGLYTIGGFAGLLYNQSDVEKCAADCTVTASQSNVGGFAGYVENNVTIRNSVAFGDVNSTVTENTPKAGGFAGVVDASAIENCHAAGKVSVQHESVKAGGFAGSESSSKFKNNSFDQQKNPGITAIADGSGEVSGIVGETTQKVLANICLDYYGGHDWDMEHWVVDRQPTTTEVGYRSHHCKRCDAAGEAEILPKLDPTPGPTAEPTPEPTAEPTAEPTVEPTVEPTPEPTPDPTPQPPRTGDASPLLLWSLLMLVSAAGMLWVVIHKQKA